MALLQADWRGDGPIRLNESLSLPDLSGCLVLDHARLVMLEMAAGKGVKLTATGNFSRKFVERMVGEFRWPGYEPEEVWWYNKVLNEPDFTPLHFLRALIDVAGLGRKYKGCFRLTRLGRSLLAPEAAGELNAVLFDAIWHRYDITGEIRKGAQAARLSSLTTFNANVRLTLENAGVGVRESLVFATPRLSRQS